MIDLRDETAVIGNGAIFGASARYWPLPGREASLLGIANKRWTRDATSGYALVDDPFLTGTRSLLDVISRAERVHTLGRAIERGTPVQLYAARVPLQAFLGKFPPFEQETTTKPGDNGPTSYRDYLANYMGADEAGQRLELAVDSQGRIRRVRLDLYEPVTVELYDYGVRVDATAPPASTVTASSAYEQLKSDYCSRPRRQILPRPYPCQ